MRRSTLVLSLLFSIFFVAFSQQTKDTPAIIYMKDGKSLDIKHFGQNKCSNVTSFDSYIMIRGQYMGNLTEMKSYEKIEKIVLEGYKEDPVSSVGNEKGILKMYMKDGNIVELTDAEMVLSCYGAGMKYNQLVVQLLNPLTGQVVEQIIPTKDIQSIVFK